MILTGKSKEDFEKWLNKEMYYLGRHKFEDRDNNIEDLAENFQNCLIIEWLDDVGLWKNIVNDTLILDRYYFKKCSWRSNIELLIITARDIYNETFK